MVHVILYQFLLIICCAYAFARGGPPERWGAGMMLAASLASLASQAQLFTGSYLRVQVWVFVIDLALLFGLFALSVGSTRFWPLWLAGIQLLAVMGHIIRVLDETTLPRGYQFLISAGAYPMLLMVAIGAWRHQKRLRLYGADISWRDSFAR